MSRTCHNRWTRNAGRISDCTGDLLGMRFGKLRVFREEGSKPGTNMPCPVIKERCLYGREGTI